MAEGPYPRLADVFPELTTDIVSLLTAEDNPLFETVGDLLFYGPCTCTPTCPILLTAPPDSLCSGLITPEREEDPLIWLWLDPSGTIVGVEVLDGRDLGPAAQKPR
jgi:hypothetical protein